MSTGIDVLADGFDRVRDLVGEVLDGLDADELAFRAGPSANSIAWLVWHLTRVQDDHVADAAGLGQVWAHWRERFHLPLPDGDTGYGHGPDEVATVRPGSADLLSGYHDEVHDQTTRFLRRLDADELDRVLDPSLDPPVTVAVRLVSVLSDDLQHVGQAAYVRGLLPSRTPT